MPKQLRVIKIEGIDYYVDKRLSQIREVGNPHNWEEVSPEIINYWITNNVSEV